MLKSDIASEKKFPLSLARFREGHFISGGNLARKLAMWHGQTMRVANASCNRNENIEKVAR